MAYVVGRDRESMDHDSMLRRAAINCVLEIGEAACRVTEEFRALVPGIPWTRIVGMRHRLIHVYWDINLDLVREVLVRDLPQLRRELESALDLSKPENP